MAGQAPAAVVCACVLTGHRAENEAWHADMLSCVERPRGDGDRSTIAVAPRLCGRRLGFTFSSAVWGKYLLERGVGKVRWPRAARKLSYSRAAPTPERGVWKNVGGNFVICHF
jgi:hypothetical protein